MSKTTLLLSSICLIVGFGCAYLLFANESKQLDQIATKEQNQASVIVQDKTPASTSGNNIFNTSDSTDRLETIENNISLLQQQLHDIESRLDNNENITAARTSPTNRPEVNKLVVNRQPRYQRTFSFDKLVKGGIDSTVADDIVRRKNAVEIKRLELSDRATRENYMNTQQYFDELAAIDATDVNLREELGDDQYDSYLYKSGQSNRIKLLSVMLGSAAEQAGLEKGDIILSYDGNRMYTWPELKQATAKGELGEYTSINISRKGEIYSYSVPRGTLGIQMGAARIAP